MLLKYTAAEIKAAVNDANPQPEGSENRKKQLEMTKGTDNAYALAKKV